MQIVDGCAGCGERGQRIFLGGVKIRLARAITPIARPEPAGPQARCDSRLPLGRIVTIKRSQLEQPDGGKAAIGIATRGIEQVGQHRRAHHIEIGADRVDEPQRSLAAAKALRRRRRNERIGYCLGQSARGKGPADQLNAPAARGVDRKLVSDIRLFDVYEGKGLPENKKSLAIAVTLQPQEATLTDTAIEAFSARLVAAVEKATGGTLRG